MSKLRHLIIFAIFCFPLIVQAECQLNQYGFNICTGESALWKKDPDVLIRVKVMELRYFETVIQDGREKTTADINELIGNIGNIDCQGDYSLCKGQKISIKPQCQSSFPEKEYLIKEVYENQMLESLEGNFFLKKIILIPFNCVEI